MSHFVTFCTSSLKCMLQRESFEEITTILAFLPGFADSWPPCCFRLIL